MPTRRYEFDVALSYASENERFVRDVARYLRGEDLRVFYAPARTAELWGKDEREFQRVYGPASQFVVPFVSAHYVTKEWPLREFRAAKKEARNRAGEFILPVRIDDTKLPGFRRTVQYVSAKRHSAREIANFLVSKIDRRRRARPAAPSRTHASIRILESEEIELLSLIATATFPLRLRHAKRLLPRVEWNRNVARWRRRGYLQSGSRYLALTPVLRRHIVASAADEERYRKRWIEILTPLQAFSDTALMLGLHYAFLRRIHDMLRVLTPIAENLEPGFFNDLYLGIFERFAKTRHLRTATSKGRVEFFNTLGLLLSRNGRHADAIAVFTTLRRLSRSARNRWGEGQSYLNAGVAAAYSGRPQAARAWYRKAIAFGRQHRDQWLVARALGNLAAFEAPATATALLAESENLTRRIGDVVGLLGTLITRGSIAAATKEFTTAAKAFRDAASHARRLDHRYVRVLALRNLGRTEVERGRPKRAIPFYRQAQAIAKAERFKDQLRDAITGEALALAEAKAFRRAEALFVRLVELHAASGDAARAAVSLHDVGAMRMKQGRHADAYTTFVDAIAAARKAKVPEWIYRSQIDAGLVAPSAAISIDLFRAGRRGAVRAHDTERVISCSRHLAQWHLARNDRESALAEIAVALRVAPSDAAALPLLADRFALVLETNSDRRINAAFRAFASAAERAGDRRYGVDAHVIAGDHLWSKRTRADRAMAYRAYVAAMFLALPLGFETVLRIGAHTASGNLHLLFREDDRMDTLDHIEQRTIRWLDREFREDVHRVIAFALWPLRVARRVLSRPDFGYHLKGRERTRILTEEVERALGGTLGQPELSRPLDATRARTTSHSSEPPTARRGR